MGNACSTSWLLNHCFNLPRTSSQSEDENYSSKTMTEPSIIPANDKQTATIIFLHGLGDIGGSWHEAFTMSRIAKSLPYVKFIFPTAPIRKVTLNMGISMTSWFDLTGLDQNAKEDQDGIEQSSKFLNDLIEEEIKNGILPERIMIGGFSMGGAIALHAALTSPHTLGGVVALSTWLPLSKTFPEALVSGDKKS
jgi:lysophospholipase-2